MAQYTTKNNNWSSAINNTSNAMNAGYGSYTPQKTVQKVNTKNTSNNNNQHKTLADIGTNTYSQKSSKQPISTNRASTSGNANQSAARPVYSQTSAYANTSYQKVNAVQAYNQGQAAARRVLKSNNIPVSQAYNKGAQIAQSIASGTKSNGQKYNWSIGSAVNTANQQRNLRAQTFNASRAQGKSVQESKYDAMDAGYGNKYANSNSDLYNLGHNIAEGARQGLGNFNVGAANNIKNQFQALGNGLQQTQNEALANQNKLAAQYGFQTTQPTEEQQHEVQNYFNKNLESPIENAVEGMQKNAGIQTASNNEALNAYYQLMQNAGSNISSAVEGMGVGGLAGALGGAGTLGATTIGNSTLGQIANNTPGLIGKAAQQVADQGVGQLAAAGFMGLGAAGNAEQEALANGATLQQALKKGGADALNETVLQEAISPWNPGGAIAPTINDVIGEGMQEFAGQYFDPYEDLAMSTSKEDFKKRLAEANAKNLTAQQFQDALKAGAAGMSGAVLNGAIVDPVGTVNQVKELPSNVKQSIDNLEAYNIDNKVDKALRIAGTNAYEKDMQAASDDVLNKVKDIYAKQSAGQQITAEDQNYIDNAQQILNKAQQDIRNKYVNQEYANSKSKVLKHGYEAAQIDNLAAEAQATGLDINNEEVANKISNMAKIANKTHTVVHFNDGQIFNTETSKYVDGLEQNGNIYINAKAADPIETIFAHEIAHASRGTQQYSMFAYTAKEMYKDGLLPDAKQAIDAINSDSSLSAEQKNNETVAVLTQNILNNDQAIAQVANETPNSLERIARDIKNLFSGTDAVSKRMQTAYDRINSALDNANPYMLQGANAYTKGETAKQKRWSRGEFTPNEISYTQMQKFSSTLSDNTGIKDTDIELGKDGVGQNIKYRWLKVDFQPEQYQSIKDVAAKNGMEVIAGDDPDASTMYLMTKEDAHKVYQSDQEQAYIDNYIRTNNLDGREETNLLALVQGSKQKLPKGYNQAQQQTQEVTANEIPIANENAQAEQQTKNINYNQALNNPETEIRNAKGNGVDISGIDVSAKTKTDNMSAQSTQDNNEQKNGEIVSANSNNDLINKLKDTKAGEAAYTQDAKERGTTQEAQTEEDRIAGQIGKSLQENGKIDQETLNNLHDYVSKTAPDIADGINADFDKKAEAAGVNIHEQETNRKARKGKFDQSDNSKVRAENRFEGGASQSETNTKEKNLHSYQQWYESKKGDLNTLFTDWLLRSSEAKSYNPVKNYLGQIDATNEQVTTDGQYLLNDIKNRIDTITKEANSAGANLKTSREGTDTIYSSDTYNTDELNFLSKQANTLESMLFDHASRCGQDLRAFGIWENISPENRLAKIQKSVDDLNEANKNRKGWKKIIIDQKLMDDYVNAKPGADRNAIELALQKNIASQIPATLGEKIKTWRYISMLANPVTALRNFVGNAGMYGLRNASNTIAAVTEKLLYKTGAVKELDQLTHLDSNGKMIASNRQNADVLYEFGKKTGITGFESNYNHKGTSVQSISGFMRGVQDQRQIFTGKYNPATYMEQFADWSLDKGDEFFINKRFSNELARMIKKSGDYTASLDEDGSLRFTDNKTGKKLSNDATMKIYNQYAEQAMKTAKVDTFHDFNAAADAINNLRDSGAVWHFLTDAVMPFTKTPMNIARRAVEYSPAGLATGIYQMSVDVREGKVDASTAIDNMAKGAVGTTAVALGVLLASLGKLNGKMPDSDEKKHMEDNGYQDYSLNCFGGTYSIDWLSPSISSVLVGAQLFNNVQTKMQSNNPDVSLDDIVSASYSLIQPILDTTYLSGLYDSMSALTGNSKYSTASGIEGVIQSAVNSYVAQYFPTVGRRLEKIIDDTQRTTSSTSYPDGLLRTAVISIPGLNAGISKIIGKDYLQPVINTKGQEVKTGGFSAANLFQQMISPGNFKKLTYDSYDEKLDKLNSTSGEKTIPQKYTYLYGTDKFNPEQRTKYNKMILGGYEDQVKKFMDSPLYSGDDAEKGAVLHSVKQYYENKARIDYFNSVGKGASTVTESHRAVVAAVDACREVGIEPYQYFYNKNISGDDADYATRANMEAEGIYDAAVSLYKSGKIEKASYLGLSDRVIALNPSEFAYKYNKKLSGEDDAESTALTPEEKRDKTLDKLAVSEDTLNTAKNIGYTDPNKFYDLLAVEGNKDESGNTLTYSRAMNVRAQMINDGTWDKFVDGVNDGSIDMTNYHMNKTVFNWSMSKFNTNYGKLQAGTWKNLSSTSKKTTATNDSGTNKTNGKSTGTNYSTKSSKKSSKTTSKTKSSSSTKSTKSSTSKSSSSTTSSSGLSKADKALLTKYLTSNKQKKISASGSSAQKLYNSIVSGHSSTVKKLKSKYKV